MEPGLILVGLVAAIGAIHLMAQAGISLNSRLPRKTVPHDRTGRQATRGDWYVFFHCADLLGREPQTASAQPRPEAQTKQRRQAAARPRPRP